MAVGLFAGLFDQPLSFSGKHQATSHVESRQPQGDQHVLMVDRNVPREAAADATERSTFSSAQHRLRVLQVAQG